MVLSVEDERGKVDWTKKATSDGHLWVDVDTTDARCHAGHDGVCKRTGPMMKCIACHVLGHKEKCIPNLNKIPCKPTFLDLNKEPMVVKHHWISHQTYKGSCTRCGQSLDESEEKTGVVFVCSWCRDAYHSEACFTLQVEDEQCGLGRHADVIVPPTWISKTQQDSRRHPLESAKDRRKTNNFSIKPVYCAQSKPLLVFINPKSGGHLGSKLYQMFCWLLNPRQVFNLLDSDPRFGLDLYRYVPRLRLLVCGGDGTVSWIHGAIDAMGWEPTPPVAVLPLGACNDLARALNWGEIIQKFKSEEISYELVSEILCDVVEGHLLALDRWSLEVVPNKASTEKKWKKESKDKLPMVVFNSYFSIGADAHVALTCQDGESEDCLKFNSKELNTFYSSAEGRDILDQSSDDLTEHIELDCQGNDVTFTLQEDKPHCLVLINNPSYIGGTLPWGHPSSEHLRTQHRDDGILEVLGLTYTSRDVPQLGNTTMLIGQGNTIRMTTYKSMPVIVDGESRLLGPSVITVSHKDQYTMVARRNHTAKTGVHTNDPVVLPDQLHVQLWWICKDRCKPQDHDKIILKEIALPLGTIDIDKKATLKQIRQEIHKLNVENVNNDVDTLGVNVTRHPSFLALTHTWCYLNSMARVGIACITSDQEGGRCVPDVCSGDLYLYEIGPLPGAPDGTPVIDVDVLNVVNVANAGRAARVGNTTAVGERADTALSELTADDAETVTSFEEVYEVVSETNNTNRPIKMYEIKTLITDYHKNDFKQHTLIFREYLDLEVQTKQQAFSTEITASELEMNHLLSYPYAHSGVRLDDATYCIDANFISGHREREYIATIVPVKERFADFWRMVWLYECKAVVMLGQYAIDGNTENEEKRYWPECVGCPVTFDDIAVEMIGVDRRDEIITRLFSLKLGKEEILVRHYWLPYFSKDSTHLSADIIDLIRMVREDNPPFAVCGPIVVHCSNGESRTGVFIALDYLRQLVISRREDDTVDVFNYVLKMRSARHNMVNCAEAYIFIYEMLNMVIESKNQKVDKTGKKILVTQHYDPDYLHEEDTPLFSPEDSVLLYF